MKSCYMVRSPKIAIVYIYPNDGAGGFMEKAGHFIDTYFNCPPGIEHETVIVCNGAPASDHARALFSEMPNVSFLNHDNSGWDIGGFQLAARTVSCDLMVFFGAHTYFRRAGWLARMLETFVQFGDTLYGSTGNQGNIAVGVYPHVRTTAFWCSPSLMNQYPHQVISVGGGGQRYEMEHGKSCLTNWVRSLSKPAWIAGWDCIFAVTNCDEMPNGYHQGNQSNVLVGDRLTMPPYHGTP